MSILDAALSRVVGFSDPAPEFDRIRALEKQIAKIGAEKRSIEAKARYEHLLRTTTDATELLEARRAMLAAGSDAVSAHEARGELDRYKRSLRETVNDLGPDAVEPALSWLHDQLSDLLAGVRETEETLGSISTIEGALRGSDEQIRAWRAIDDAVGRYEEIRSTQKLLSTKVAGFDAVSNADLYRLLEEHGHMRAAFEVEAHYIEKRKPLSSRGHWTNHHHVDRWWEWRTDVIRPTWRREPRSVWPEEGTQHEYLRYLARTGGAWVPTIAQLEHAGAAVNAMLNVQNLTDLRLALAAHDRYFRDRGIKPRVPLDTDAYRASLPGVRRGGRRVDEAPQVDPRLLGVLAE